MNYRHAYHAGNHADVLKHAVLARALQRLAAKDKAFAVLDAHAGTGIYDLHSVESGKTEEWQSGIGLMRAPFEADVEQVLAPYRQVCAALNHGGEIRYYPGSTEIALRLLRAQDRLIANELHSEEVENLRQNYFGQKQVTITESDALNAVKANLPFKERRGLVLIDPPYEVKDESGRLRRMLVEAVKRFETGVVLIWYPVTSQEFVDGLLDGLAGTAISNLLCAELRVKNAHAEAGLSGSGLIIRNPPFGLEEDIRILLTALALRLGVEMLGRSQVSWLTPKKN